jgi:tRNA threonylcarbamoyladenosine biosynthesis protein TsaE
MSPTVTLHLADEAATLVLAATLAGTLTPGMMLRLEGDLGAGKTTFVRGILRALGDAGPVRSPTYTLVELHAVSGLNLYHFDFYRFNQAEDFLDAGLEEYFGTEGICLVEWPDRAGPYLPPADLRISLSVLASGRSARVEAVSPRGEPCVARLIGAGGISLGSP